MGAVFPWGLGQGPECPVGPPGPWTAALPHAQVCVVSPSDICLSGITNSSCILWPSQGWLPCVYYGMVTI